MPPVEIIAEWMQAAQKLRDQIDSEVAGWGDDPHAAAFDPTIEAFDNAAKRLSAWLAQPHP